MVGGLIVSQMLTLFDAGDLPGLRAAGPSGRLARAPRLRPASPSKGLNEYFGAFIARPVATTLITIGLALAGVLAFRLLPIAPLPQVDFPTISVSAAARREPGHHAATVATPLERALGSIAVTEITSRSSLGSVNVTIQFDLNRNIDGAARDVQAAINAARSLLPSGLPSNPTYRKVNPADAPIMILALTSDTLTRGQMYDAASTVLAQRLSQVRRRRCGQRRRGALPAVRVELDPDKLAAKGIALDNVRLALTSTNANRPKGSLELDGRYWQIGANDQARTAAEYAPILLSYRDGAAVRLRDVADVSDSVQDLRNYGMANGKPAIVLIVQKEPGANIIETVERVREILPRLQASISQAINLDVISDRSPTIRASLREVERAMAIAIGLVILVVLLFLRSWRATLLPAVAVPVSLAGTVGVMYLCGYSFDNLSAMALTVATGFVVDDAIVVLENITRYIERGLSPREAALKGAKEIGFTVVSISLSLVAVFIPILMMGGVVGRLFREFAVVLAASILVSMVVSLTTTPMMAATLLAPRKARRPKDGSRGRSPAASGPWCNGYRRSLSDAAAPARGAPARCSGGAQRISHDNPEDVLPQQDTGAHRRCRPTRQLVPDDAAAAGNVRRSSAKIRRWRASPAPLQRGSKRRQRTRQLLHHAGAITTQGRGRRDRGAIARQAARAGCQYVLAADTASAAGQRPVPHVAGRRARRSRT
jgi:multidrug efflux pump